MAALHFELVSPAKLLFSGEVESVSIPGTEGDMGIFAGPAKYCSGVNTAAVHGNLSCSQTVRAGSIPAQA